VGPPSPALKSLALSSAAPAPLRLTLVLTTADLPLVSAWHPTRFSATPITCPSLPLLGIGAALGWSRRLRRRIGAAKD